MKHVISLDDFIVTDIDQMFGKRLASENGRKTLDARLDLLNNSIIYIVKTADGSVLDMKSKIEDAIERYNEL